MHKLSSQKKYEEYAYVLDSFKGGGRSIQPRVQLVGENYFTLLEATAKLDATFSIHERVYIGKNFRDKISYIIRRLRYDELTSLAKSELSTVIEKIVREREKDFVDWFNKVQSVTPRMHGLELLPSIGKTSMRKILEEREKKPFTSYEDIRKRTSIPNPVKILSKRILNELSNPETRYRLFTRAD